VAWIALALDSLWQARRDRTPRRALGPVVLRVWRPSLWVGGVVAAVALAGAVVLERVAGRFVYRPGVALAGLVLVTVGLVLNHRARRALGPHWAALVQVREAHTLVKHGPYAHVRHPIYAAGLLLAAGSFLAHPSPAAASLAGGFSAGLVLKARLEDRTLAATFGEEYRRYAARVPALVPGLAWTVSGRRR
jgi:protein-S-isoprenylcysteine O-methyltransferase Ste14